MPNDTGAIRLKCPDCGITSERFNQCDRWDCKFKTSVPSPHYPGCPSTQGFLKCTCFEHDAAAKGAIPSVPSSTDKPFPIRQFDTGATRDQDAGKLDFEAFLSPLVLESFARYMHKHRVQPDGSLRDGDNWQKGMPLECYMKSGWRHFFEWWRLHRDTRLFSSSGDELEGALCGVLFNAMGYMHELLKGRPR